MTENNQYNYSNGQNGQNNQGAQWNGSEYRSISGSSQPSGGAPGNTGSGNYNEVPGQFQYLFRNDSAPQAAAASPEAPKKNKRTHSRRTARTALLVAACMVLSVGAGFGGGWAAMRYIGGGSTVLYQAVPESGSSLSGTAAADSGTIASVVSKVSSSVVEITTESLSTGLFVQQYVTDGAGSGVILSQDGYIVTNNHVVEGASKITVTTKDGQSYDATLIGTDTKTDLAVIKIDATDLTPAVLGDSDTLQVGEDAIVIGNPLGQLGGTVTNGIISAKSRDVTIDGETMSLLQTNAAVNPGNSGGGLFDIEGNLVGIINAKSSGSDVEGLGFAIPINTARPVIEDLISSGYVSGRPSMGVTIIDILDFQTAMRYQVNRLGVYIMTVNPGSGAEAAGLKTGDYILTADGTEVASSSDLQAAIDSHEVGDTLELTILRGGSVMDISVTLGEYVPVESDS